MTWSSGRVFASNFRPRPDSYGRPPSPLYLPKSQAMRPSPPEQVELCCRCGQAAECPVVGCGRVAGREEDHLPLCVDCFQLLREDSGAFWDGFGRGCPFPNS
jgi:hypothetical protein